MKYKPAQPVAGPGRAMPVAWNFDTKNTTVGVAAGDNGSGPDAAILWGGNNPKATAASWEKNTVVSHLLVYGRYVAGPCHLPINMRNGSTLDLSKITGSFDLTNTVANTASFVPDGVIGDMIFQPGTAEKPSIINVNLAGKTDLRAIRKSESPYVVTWLSQPANVEFVLDAQSKANGYRISPEAGGLRLNRTMAFMILVK